MTIENAVAIVVIPGLGGILGTYLRIIRERNNTAHLQKQEYKERRYKAIILLMNTDLDFDEQVDFLRKERPDLISLAKLNTELKTEWHSMFLYASDEVVQTTHDFIINPSSSSYKMAIMAMRKDLWGGKLNTEVRRLEF